MFSEPGNRIYWLPGCLISTMAFFFIAALAGYRLEGNLSIWLPSAAAIDLEG
jgi:hypothetical protein